MKFKEKLKAAGFKTQKEFAVFCGRTEKTIYHWSLNTPGEVDAFLELRIRVLKFAGDVL